MDQAIYRLEKSLFETDYRLIDIGTESNYDC